MLQNFAAKVLPASFYREGEPYPHHNQCTKLQIAFDRSGNPNHLVNVEIDGKEVQLLSKDVQRHPVTANIRHVDFYQVQDDEAITVSVPIEIVGNQSVLDGWSMTISSCKLMTQGIPATMQIDVTDLNVEVLRSFSGKTSEGVEVIYSSDLKIY